MKRFRRNVERGRRFEATEKAGWVHVPKDTMMFEAATAWAGRRGRIDIKINDSDGSVTVVEIKATDWNRIKLDRIRPTVQRHARQIWRYINDQLQDQRKDVCPGIVYEIEPKRRETRQLVEQILNDKFVQVAWRNESSSTRKREPFNP